MGTESWRSATGGSKVVGAETRGRRGCDPAVAMRGCVEVVRINVEEDRRTRHEQTLGTLSNAVPRVVCCTEMCRLEIEQVEAEKCSVMDRKREVKRLG